MHLQNNKLNTSVHLSKNSMILTSYMDVVKEVMCHQHNYTLSQNNYVLST